jgi:hypothetical protein
MGGQSCSSSDPNGPEEAIVTKRVAENEAGKILETISSEPRQAPV